MEKPDETALSTPAVEGPLLPLAAFEPPLDWARVFGRAAPVEVDIGSGKGRFVVESARAHPERNYLGIERSLKWARFSANKVAKSRVKNARIVCVDAHGLIASGFPDASVAAYTLHHPDPWPKTRHHKRRIVRPEFVAELARTLRPGGTLGVQSDVAELFAEIERAIAENAAFERVEFAAPEDEGFDGFTSFERKYLLEGRTIHRAQFRRR